MSNFELHKTTKTSAMILVPKIYFPFIFFFELELFVQNYSLFLEYLALKKEMVLQIFNFFVYYPGKPDLDESIREIVVASQIKK